MSYFGFPTDLFEALAQECEASAAMHDAPVSHAMIYLSKHLNELAPLYEAICKYGIDDDATDSDVALQLQYLLAKRKQGT